MQWLNELNEQQRQAAEAADGPVVIVAGPGTGKTKTLTARIAYLVASGRAAPEQILALTFTKKAAEEMRSRVTTLLAAQKTAGAPAISTFHALCHELLGGDTAFISEPARLQIIKQLSRPASLKGLSTRELALRISRAKNMADDQPDLQEVVAAYDAALREQNLRDFDDLLVQLYELLATDKDMRQSLQDRYTHILVDEFQDTNRLQYELLQLLRGTDNVFVIGDPNQSIYGFRGASGGIFDQFTADFPGALRVTLSANYRSVPAVVAVANRVFGDAAPLEAQTTVAGHVQAMQLLNEYSEAKWIVGEIQRAIGGGDMLQATSDNVRERSLKDFAILYRGRAVAVAVQRAIDESGLPYQIVGDDSPYEQPAVQALIALLRSSVTNESPMLEGFTDATVRTVQDMLLVNTAAAPAKLAERLADTLGFERTASLQQFIIMLVRFTTVPAALEYLDMIAESRFYDSTADAITLLTIHAAKGLEFPHVFLVAAEEGVVPHERSDEAEERRLFYVAVTRAREALDITHVKHRGSKQAEASRFVRAIQPEILPQVIDPHMADDIRRAQKRAAKRSQQSLF
jgi:superfamily I DNA/RNA helicase